MDRLGGRAEDALMTRPADAAAIARWALLFLAVLVGTALRVDRLGRPSYWLDEILGQQLTTEAARQPLSHWVTGLEPEHGPLYYATQLASRVAGDDEFAGRLAAASFGIVTIIAVWSAGALTGGGVVAAIAAVLLATSPLHVYYSREARPYALVMLLTAALIVFLLRRSIGGAAAMLIALLYTSAVALPVVTAAAVTAFAAGWLESDRAVRKRLFVIAAVASFVAVLFTGLYRGSPSSHDLAFPSSARAVIVETCRALTVSALGAAEHGRTTIVLVALAVIGAVVLARRNRVVAAIAIGMTLLPALFAAASLRVVGHWFAVRYVAPALIGFVLLASCGIAFAAEAAAIPLRRWKTAVTTSVAAVIMIAIVAQTWTAARREPFEKIDWRSIAAALERHVRPGDALVFADPWSDVCTRYYLHSLPAGVRIALTAPHMSQILTMTRPAVWFVSDGFSPTALRNWACRFPVVLSTRLESVRVHYAPSARDYVRTHGTAEDVRAAAAALGAGAAVRVGVDDGAVLGDGWGTPEGSPTDAFRWAIGGEASFVVPRRGARDRIVRIHAMPAARTSQQLTLVVNGQAVAAAAMSDGWTDYSFDVPANAWRDGLNTIAFRFARAIEPASLDPRSTDRRPLAACFAAFAVYDRGTAVPMPYALPPSLPASFASADLLAARGVERSDKTRFPAAQLDRAHVEPFLGRLGIDPLGAWPLLASDRLHVEDVADTIAYGSGCEDDRAFLEHAFAVMVQRHPNSVEQRDLLDRLRRGASRVQIVRRITNADDFRALMLRR